jgi:L-ascorbate metabolism protein UlaG (beta-lactamase superfamily)
MSNIIKKFGYMYELHKRNFKNYFIRPQKPTNEPLIENSIHWIGHSTVLININGKIIVTDPVTSMSLGHLKRLVYPSKNLGNIKLDYILLSHGHIDHINYNTLRKLNKDAVVICPKNYKHSINFLGFNKVFPINPGENYRDEFFNIQAYEANHDGRRYYMGRISKSSAYLITGKKKSVFFAGDTAFTDNFKGIKADVALMPVGCYKPDDFLSLHCSPEQSFKMFKMTNAKFMIPIHYKTFILSQDDDIATVQDLKKLNDGTIKLINIGQTIKLL